MGESVENRDEAERHRLMLEWEQSRTEEWVGVRHGTARREWDRQRFPC